MVNQCPVCLNKYSRPSTVVEDFNIGNYVVGCPNCGDFTIEREAWEDFLDPQTGLGSQVSDATRMRLAHVVWSNRKSKAHLNSDFVGRFVREKPTNPTPQEQAVHIIRHVGDKVAETGDALKSLPENMAVIAGSPSRRFCDRLVEGLHADGTLLGIPHKPMSGEFDLLNCDLSLAGWKLYEDEKRGRIVGEYGFIAMKFGDDILDPMVSDIIKPNVLEILGYEIRDMRDVAQAGVIDNIMREQIRDAKFVLVDLTHDNAGAYWEAGYAEGLGKPVIYLCEQEKFDEDKTHFDTNHCTTVIWQQGHHDRFVQDLTATISRSLNELQSA